MKTRQKLFDAYLSLLEQQTPERMTIQMLTTKANINRVTFYKHFHNLVEFHEQFIEHYILELYEFMKPLNYKTYTKGFEYEALLQLLEHIKANQITYKILLTSQNITGFNKALLAHFQQRISKHTTELAKFDFPGTGVNQIIVSWYGVSALFGTIRYYHNVGGV
ncbi:TetR/AcrR family transcriptional regulator [Solibacillus daqui]|uniref:TetR/AcrR family transcriptional regulator n=1 Tax=Solibacillus daqui TaxID=2912187 RepID=UPI0023651F1B|nr:TetR/AcrR family transcriptional regulator [Solibacillus daqui]